MKKNLIIAACAFIALGAFLYVRSQEPIEKETEQKVSESAATVTVTKEMLDELRKKLINLQVKIAGNKEKLAKMIMQWKRDGKLQFAESWNQTNLGINKLLSTLQQVANSGDLIEKLRRNGEAYSALKNLLQQIKPFEKSSDIKQIMAETRLLGKVLFVDKLFEKLDKINEEKAKDALPDDQLDSYPFSNYESTGSFDYSAPSSSESYSDNYSSYGSFTEEGFVDDDIFDLNF